NRGQAEEPEIVRVEEDWELVVSDPSVPLTAPQVSCLISPYCNCNCLHAAFEINHRNLPDFSPGGLQLQVWQGEEAKSYQSHGQTAAMNLPGETVRWTQRMYVNADSLWFEVDNLTSTTWGNISGQGALKVSVAYPH